MSEASHIGYLMRKINNSTMRVILGALRQEGLDETTVSNGWILHFLYENQDNDVFQRDIEAECNIGRSSVTKIVKLMEKKELIRRESVEHDARLKKLVLTEKGCQAHLQTRAIICRAEEAFYDDFSAEEMTQFTATLSKLESNLKKQEELLRCSKH